MDNFDLYQMRLGDSRKIAKSKLVDIKIKTFKRALDSSYNSESVSMGDNEFQALITGIPTSPLINKKNFATLLDNECEVGDSLYWGSNNSHWLITEHDSTEGAVFQGSIERALYELKWKDPVLDKIYSTRACAKGPDETTIGDGVKHSIFFDVLTDSLYLIVSGKAEGVEFLTRYSEIMVDSKKWRIEVEDSTTKENLIFLQLTEASFDRDKDTEDVVGGKEEVVFVMDTPLDGVSTIAHNSEINFVPTLLRNGKVLDRGEILVRATNCTYNDNRIVFDRLGLSSITVNFKDYNEIFKIEINVVEETIEKNITKKIIGSESLRTFNVYEYTALHTENGQSVIVPGVWTYDKNFFEEVLIDGNIITLKAKNKPGKTEITFANGEIEVSKEVRIVPLFGGS